MTGITERADISRLLTQIRDVKAHTDPQMSATRIERIRQDGPLLGGVSREDQLAGVTANPLRIGPVSTQENQFGSMLKQAIHSVNDSQLKAGELQRAYELGEGNVDLTQVMIQMQKSTIAFEAMTQVRNRVISAYQDVMNMPI